MQEIIVDQCDCPFEVSAIIDLKDLVPGTKYSYTIALMNAGKGVFHPNAGEFLADSDIDTLNLTMYLSDNPNHHYLINFELFDPYYDTVRRQIICVKNIGCSPIQCTPTVTPTPTRHPYLLDKYLDLANYKVSADKKYAASKSIITVGDWVEFLNSVATYDDINKLWKPEMESDIKCGIQRTYDGFFYVYTINGCDVDQFGCYDNDNDQVSREISYVSWSDLARYINWIHNGKPQGRQGPETTEDGSYPLYGNRYPYPGIPYHAGARFWLDTTTVIQACPVTATPTNTPTPSVTIGLTPTATPTTTATRTPTPSVTPPTASLTPTTTLTATPTSTVTLTPTTTLTLTPTTTTTATLTATPTSTVTLTPTTTTTLTSSPTQTPSNLPVGLTITVQPDTDVFTAVGFSQTISVTAVAVPSTITILYQWQRSVDNGSSWSNIAGAVSRTYTINNTLLINTGDQYRVVVNGLSSSGLNNPATVTSNTATLTVSPAIISIDSQPTNTTITDTFASFSVTASINPSYVTLTYQWQLSTNSGVSFSNISGATTSTLSLSNLTTANTGNVYRVVVSGNGGASPVDSSSATLIVNAPEITITTHPQDTISQNASATFSVSATIDGRTTPYLLSYAWERSSDGGLTFVSIPGATGSSYTINNITKSLDNYLYDVRVSSNVGSSPVVSNIAKLSVNDNYGALFVWGSNSSSQLNAVTGSTTNIPKYTNRTTSIYRSASFGQNHGLFINASGILETYGINTLGQTVGNGRTAIYDISTKYNHNLALIEEATGYKLYSWGANSFGQCGLGNTSSAITTVTAIPNDNNSYMDIAVGENHSLAVRNNGMMVACGRNDVGQLGIGNNNSQTTFVTVSGNIDKVACGQSHSAAITTNGILYTWGNNANGQLGLADNTARTSPTAVSGTAWTQVVCGQNFTAALNASNELYTWGSNAQGQLGINSNVDSNIPVKVGNIAWENISAGNLHMLGVSTENKLYSWGNGAQSQIGNALAINSLEPIKIGENPDDQWEIVSAGGNSSSAIRRGAIISITSHPTNTESRDGAASFSVVATITAGGLLSYQWQESSNNGVSWSNLAGKTSSTLTLSSLNTNSDGYRYRCAISGTEGAYTLYSDSAILVEKSATIYYRGANDGSNSIPTNPGTVWAQWSGWNISSTSINRGTSLTATIKPTNTTVKQFVRIGLNSTAFLLSDGTVIGLTATASANTTYDFNAINSTAGSFRFDNPVGEKIVKLIGNYGVYTGGLLYGRTFLWGISESGKLYGIVPSGANYGGTPNAWNRIGSSLIITDAAACAHNGTYLPTVFAIATDGTLWAWGDGRLINTTAAGTPSFNNAPVRINTDVWTAIAGNMGGFYGIKSDGAVYRLAGVWNGGAVSGRNGATTISFNSGTAGANVNSNPILIDNSVAYTKLVANGTILIGYDINNKFHINPTFNTPRNLPPQWNNISNILLGTNTAAQGAVILTDNNYTSVNNIAIVTAAATPQYYEYGTTITTIYNSISTKPWGTGTTTSPTTIPETSARFNYVIPDFPGYYIALKDD